MTEEIRDLNIEEKIAKFLANPDNYTTTEANNLLGLWVEYEDDMEANAKAHAEKMKIASVLGKSVKKLNRDPKIDVFKESLSDFVISVKARAIVLGNAIKKKFKKVETKQ